MGNSCKFYKRGGRCVSNENGLCGYINNEDECVEMLRITHKENDMKMRINKDHVYSDQLCDKCGHCMVHMTNDDESNFSMCERCNYRQQEMDMGMKEENNGGSTDYYKFKPEWKDCQDIIEDRKMTFAQGNIFKAAFCFNIQRHDGSTPERELNKIIWFAKRLLDEL